MVSIYWIKLPILIESLYFQNELWLERSIYPRLKKFTKFGQIKSSFRLFEIKEYIVKKSSLAPYPNNLVQLNFIILKSLDNVHKLEL